MISRVSGTCETGHWCSLYYETIKNSFSVNVKLTVRKSQVKLRQCIWTYIKKSFTVVFQLVLTVNSKSTYFMNIFQRKRKNLFHKFSLLSSIIYVRINGEAWMRLSYCCCFLSSLTFRQHVNNFFHQFSKLCSFTAFEQQKQLSRGVLKNFAKFTGKYLCQSLF